ncbi:MAG: transglycosylase domain-containing protein [Bacteroidetes bacterium]|nr:transglycosylase domain-containing protein [Bacteroidota bacterium]
MSFKKILLLFFILLAVVGACFMLFRDVILEQSLLQIQKKIFDKYQVKIEYRDAGFEGFARVVINNLSVTPPSGDTLLYCTKTAADISLIRYVKGQPPINNFLLESGYIHLINKNDSTTNYAFVFNKKKNGEAENTTKTSEKSFSLILGKIWKNFFDLADFNFQVTDFNIKWLNNNESENVLLEACSLNKTRLNMVATAAQASPGTKWEVIGTVDPKSEILDLHVGTSNNLVTRVPFFEKITGIKFFLNSFGLSLSMHKENNHTLRFNINAAAVAPGINHWRISPEDVLIDSVGVNFKVFVDDTSFYSGKESVLIINQLALLTHLSYSKNIQNRITTVININETDAGIFFNSLPKGLFSTLEKIKISGKISYKLKLDVNLEVPDSLLFESELKKSNLKILQYGNENFASINSSFTYTAREKEKVMRVFQVGPENPMFTPIELINPLLISSVLTAEDGTFYFHRGFNEEAFRESMVTNIKEKRFARGGSTISMQLVKNVFLNRNKTISRKIEEALIVWLIENNGIVSKSRMLEVYLNIIEWGPGIYGIGEAAEFYFSKNLFNSI